MDGIYQGYQLHSDAMAPLRALARSASDLFSQPWPVGAAWLRSLAAANEVLWRARLTHKRPDYGIASVTVDRSEVEVREEAAHVGPFGTLLHFKKDIAATQPRVLLVAPMSGHFATLLRPTVQTMLVDHDVYITDWHNARNVPLAEGRFDLDDFIDFLIKSLEVIGPGAHIVAICQPSVPTLAAAAIMAQGGNPARPCSIRPYLKRHHMQSGVGHYGVFSGKRWTQQVYPHLREVIYFSD